MTQPTNVPSDRKPLTKAALHAKLMTGWSRAISTCGGKASFAERMDITTEALRQQNNGSFPSFELIDRAYDIDPSILDDWLAEKGARIVDRDAVCDTDDVSVLVSRLLNKLIEAQHPDSLGGRRIVPPEVFGMEDLLREVIRVSGTLLEQAAAYRGENVAPMRRTA